MKNTIKITFLIMLYSSVVSGQEVNFPELEAKKIETRIDNLKYFEEQYGNPETADYFAFYKGVYELATTKALSVMEIISTPNDPYPWERAISKKQAQTLFGNIQDSIYVEKNSIAKSRKTATSEIRIIAPYALKLSEKEIQQFESGSLRNSDNILDDIKYNYLHYNLINEKGEVVDITQEYLGVCNGGINKRQNILYHDFCMFNQSLEPEYNSLKGSLNLEIQIPINYTVQEIRKSDVGKIFSIGENRIEIIEFDNNAFHYRILQKGMPFKVEHNVRNLSELIIPYENYKKLRQNQGLTYKEVMDKKDFFEIDKPLDGYNKEVFITKFDDKTTDVVYFYIPEYQSKSIELLVNIES